MKVKNLGTKEDGWAGPAGKSFGIEHGCRNGCLYCWARLEKDKKGFISWDDWCNPIPRKTKQSISHLENGRYMFPSTHDICPENQQAVLQVCLEILKKDNDLLIVSKPNYKSINFLAQKLLDYIDRIEFRFSIGSTNSKILKRFEPHAPSFLERKRSLMLVHSLSYRTSVSIEPYLDVFPEEIVRELKEFVSGDFWVGPMNYLSQLTRKVPALSELCYIYSPIIRSMIKQKLDNIKGVSIKYKNNW